MSYDEQRRIFERWLREHAGVLHRVASGFAIGADRADLLQELMLAMWRAVPAFAGGSKPSTFIYRVAHNAALTWWRGASTYARRVAQYAGEVPLAAEQDGAARDREAEALAVVYAAIRELPPLDRSLILLQLDGVSYAAMAEIHGLTENHVGVRLARIRQKLTDMLKEKTHELR